MVKILTIKSEGRTGKLKERLILNPPEGRLPETLIPVNEVLLIAHEVLLEGNVEGYNDPTVFIRERTK